MDGDFQIIKTLKLRVSATQCDKRFKGKHTFWFWEQLHAYTEKLLLWNFERSSTSGNASKTHTLFCTTAATEIFGSSSYISVQNAFIVI